MVEFDDPEQLCAAVEAQPGKHVASHHQTRHRAAEFDLSSDLPRTCDLVQLSFSHAQKFQVLLCRPHLRPRQFELIVAFVFLEPIHGV